MTKYRVIAWLIIGGVLAVGQPAVAQNAVGDADAGRKLAQTSCIECHVVSREAELGGHVGPRFTDVAKMPSTTALSLHVFLQSPHAKMPSLQLTRTELDDVVAYILSLSGK